MRNAVFPRSFGVIMGATITGASAALMNVRLADIRPAGVGYILIKCIVLGFISGLTVWAIARAINTSAFTPTEDGTKPAKDGIDDGWE